MKNKCKQLLALILTLATCLSILPVSVLAAETNIPSSATETLEPSEEKEVAQEEVNTQKTEQWTIVK